MTDRDENVLKFPAKDNDEEQLRSLKTEAERLADQSEIERSFFLPRCANEIGVSVTTLKAAVGAVLRERAMSAAAARLERDRERKRQIGRAHV